MHDAVDAALSSSAGNRRRTRRSRRVAQLLRKCSARSTSKSTVAPFEFEVEVISSSNVSDVLCTASQVISPMAQARMPPGAAVAVPSNSGNTNADVTDAVSPGRPLQYDHQDAVADVVVPNVLDASNSSIADSIVCDPNDISFVPLPTLLMPDRSAGVSLRQRAPVVAIFADYDSCFDILNPLIQEAPATQKCSRKFFEHHGVLEKRDGAVKLVEAFLEDITRDRQVYLFVGSNRQSLYFDRIMASNIGGISAIGDGAYEAIAKERGWTLNYALVGDVGSKGEPRWTRDTPGSAWIDENKRQPIEPASAGKRNVADERRLKLMMVENNFAQLPEESGVVDVYFFDDRSEFLDYTRENAQIPTNINFHTVHWDYMGYIIDGWTADSHPIMAKATPSVSSCALDSHRVEAKKDIPQLSGSVLEMLDVLDRCVYGEKKHGNTSDRIINLEKHLGVMARVGQSLKERCEALYRKTYR